MIVFLALVRLIAAFWATTWKTISHNFSSGSRSLRSKRACLGFESHQDGDPVLDVADKNHRRYLVGLLPLLVDQGEVDVQPIGDRSYPEIKVWTVAIEAGARSPRVLATWKGRPCGIRRRPKPVLKARLQQRRIGSEGCVFESQCQQSFSPQNLY